MTAPVQRLVYSEHPAISFPDALKEPMRQWSIAARNLTSPLDERSPFGDILYRIAKIFFGVILFAPLLALYIVGSLLGGCGPQTAHKVHVETIKLNIHERDVAAKKPSKVDDRLSRAIPLSPARFGEVLEKGDQEPSVMGWASLASEDLNAPFPAVTSSHDVDYSVSNPTLDVKTGYLAAYVEAKGHRPGMEDETLIDLLVLGPDSPKIPFFAVFDGHSHLPAATGGAQVVGYLKQHACEHFIEVLKDAEHTTGKRLHEMTDTEIEQLLVEGCIAIDRAILDKPFATSGATMSAAMIIGQHVWCINVGDCRTLLIDNAAEPVQMSEDALPGVLRFRQSVEKRGGKVVSDKEIGVFRVGNILAVARAFGDSEIVGVSARPKITKRPLGQGLAIFSDGLSDRLSSWQIAHHLSDCLQSGNHLEQAAYQLIRAGILKGGRDNEALILVDTRRLRNSDEGLPLAWRPAAAS